MDFSPTPEQVTLRKEIIEFARRELNEGARRRDQSRTFDRELWRSCGKLKLQGLPVPTELGGKGLDSLSCALALEAFGYGCVDGGLVFALAAHLLAGTVPLWKHGSEAQCREYLPKLCDGTWVAANALTEPAAGSDIFSLTTSAVPDGDGFRLNGSKTLITNAPVADVAIVFAVTDSQKGFHGGLSAFIVDLSQAGIERPAALDMMSVRSCAVGELRLNDVYVPASGLIGELGSGSGVFTTAMNWERTCLFAVHVGAMERLLELAIKRARSRTQFSQTIGKFQSVANRLVDMKVNLEAARLLVYRAAWRLERDRTVSLDASIAKLFTSESLLSTALGTLRTYGGSGLFTESDVERALRDAVAATLYSGTNDIQRDIIARWMGL
ncbi:MAG: acyl-CoA dehydrogenase family protein [Pirellulales bacterium]